MSYQVLARKWRPKSFESLVGQDAVVRALTHALDANRLHHAYLLTGTRGVGKTTIARILAKALNCEQGVSSKPCGVCSACQQIDAGRFVDYIEMDAASNRGVDEMVQLLEQATFLPSVGRYKVYMIDEVHQLTAHAFNAMLKTLEEPPAHVKFILATTDPQKILVTVLSRCLQFNLRQVSPHQLASHLEHVLNGEGISPDMKALELIARAAGGSVRDALSLLDQAIAHGGGSVVADQVSQMLGTSNMSRMVGMLSSLIQGDVSAVREQTSQMAAGALSFELALDDLSRLAVSLQLMQFDASEGSQEFSALAEDDAQQLRLLSTQCSRAYAQLIYQVATKARGDLRLAPDAAHGFLMAMLRLSAVHPGHVSEAQPVMVATPVKVQASPAQAMVPPVVTPPVAEVRSAVAPVPKSTEHLSDLSTEIWPQTVERLGLKGMARELVQHSAFASFAEGLVSLNLPATHRQLLMPASEQRVTQALSELLGAQVRVKFDVVEQVGVTAAVLKKEAAEERQNTAVAAIESDPLVQELIDVFDAKLIDGSIRPVTG
ncbi:MAG: DNA polymerase III subunits gamma and tau [Fluviibacter phosphoraccumulans EoVTN8]